MEVVSTPLVTETWERGLPQTLYFSHFENVEFFWALLPGLFSVIHLYVFQGVLSFYCSGLLVVLGT